MLTEKENTIIFGGTNIRPLDRLCFHGQALATGISTEITRLVTFGDPGKRALVRSLEEQQERIFKTSENVLGPQTFKVATQEVALLLSALPKTGYVLASGVFTGSLGFVYASRFLTPEFASTYLSHVNTERLFWAGVTSALAVAGIHKIQEVIQGK